MEVIRFILKALKPPKPNYETLIVNLSKATIVMNLGLTILATVSSLTGSRIECDFGVSIDLRFLLSYCQEAVQSTVQNAVGLCTSTLASLPYFAMLPYVLFATFIIPLLGFLGMKWTEKGVLQSLITRGKHFYQLFVYFSKHFVTYFTL